MRKGKLTARHRENIIGYLLILPAVLIIIGIGVVPMGKTFLYSLQYYSLTDPLNQKWIGLDNYISIINPHTLEGKSFYNALKNTAVFSLFSVAFELMVGFTGAFLMKKEHRGQGLIRAAVLIPWAIPGIVIAQMFSYLFNDQLGVVNQILLTLGIINKNVVWLASPNTAMAAVVCADVWKQFPYVALMLLAGLQVIDKEQYESAQVDGAGKIRQFLYVTLPNIKPILLVVILFRTMGAVRIFDIIYGMTGGGPANSTDTLLNSAYRYLFGDLNYGLGSAMTMVITIIIFLLSMFYIKTLKSRD